MLNTYPQFRPVYNSPSYGDYACGVKVRMFYPAGCTGEHVFVPQTLLFAVKAYLACIGRVHKLHRDADSSRLIDNLLLQLVKAPTAHVPIAMRVPNKGFLADAAELFHPDDSGVVPLGVLYKLFGQVVIIVPDLSSLISGKLSQFLVRTFRGLRLKTGSYFSSLLFKLFPLYSRRRKARGGISGMTKTQVDTDRDALPQRGIFLLDDNMQKPHFSFLQKSCARRFFALQSFALVMPEFQIHLFSAMQSGQRDFPTFFPERKDTSVILNAGCAELFRECSPFLFFRSQGSRNSPDGSNRQIGAQTELCSNLAVAQFMQFYGIVRLMLQGVLQDLIASICKGLLCLKKCLRRFLRTLQFATDRSHRHGKKSYRMSKILLTKKERQFLPALKDRVSLPSIR